MYSRFWGKCAFPIHRGRANRAAIAAIAAVVFASAVAGTLELAGASPTGGAVATAAMSEIDTEDVFGFVEGADIGRAGEQEVEIDGSLRSGKSTGTYNAAATAFQYKYTAFADFRISAVATLADYEIDGVAGLSNLDRMSMQSLSFDARFRLLDRAKAPFGATLSLQPHWGFADETSGVPLQHFGWVALLLADRELVPDKLVGAINLSFDTDRTRLLPNHAVEQEPTPGIGAALAAQIAPDLWLGGEARYLRSYDGASLQVFSGQALYAGPTLYARIGKQGWVSAAFNIQIWGGAVGVPGGLDLVNFERYQAKLRIGFEL